MEPDMWRDLLVAELMKRRSHVEMLENYYTGNHPMPAPPGRLTPAAFNEARKAYSALMKMGVTNWVKLVADAPSERLEPVGFRFSREAGDTADNRAWDLWQRSNLDAVSALVHDNALQTGQSFTLINPETGEVTGEHAGQMIVAYAPGSSVAVAALKMWHEGENEQMATLYTPTDVYKWERKNLGARWIERAEVMSHSLGALPVVEFAANKSLKPRPFGGGVGEFETVLSIQDRINKTIFDRLVTAEFQAFRQRWIVGWSPEFDEDTGLPKADAVQKASQSMLWTFEGDPQDIKVGEFSQADFAAFIKATEADVNAMAAISKTPPHYLLGAMVNISGDALTAAESGLSAKTRKHARNFGDSWEQVIRLSARAVGDTAIADDMSSQLIWGDIEHRTWGEQVDAVLKMQALDVPREALWERLPDVTPQDIERWRTDAAVQALLTAPEAPESDAEPVGAA